MFTRLLHSFISKAPLKFFSCANKIRRISRRDFKTYKRVKKFMGKKDLSKEGLRKYVNHEVHLRVSSEGMEPSSFRSLSKASMFIRVSRQTLEYTHKHKRPLITKRKGGAKVFVIKWLEST